MIAQQWKTAANAVTLLRVALTPFVIAKVIHHQPIEAALWFAVAAFTDLVDGWLARAQHSATATVGRYLDPIADKLLLSGVFLALTIEGSLPLWFLVLVLGRDLAILIASAIAMRVSTYSDYTPTIWGKISTALQILAAVTVITTNAEGSGSWRQAAQAAVWAAAAGTAWSTVHYTWRGVSYFIRRSSVPRSV